MAVTKLSLNIVTTKRVKLENIDDTDEYLNIKKTTTHVKMNKILNSYDRDNIIPRYVATPLPPLNFNQIEKTWPRKVNNAESSTYCGKNFIAIITGRYPLRASNKSVSAARYLFPVLSTFVAPIFPEPIFLTSWFVSNFVKINPKGIDPARYENKITIIISIKG